MKRYAFLSVNACRPHSYDKYVLVGTIDYFIGGNRYQLGLAKDVHVGRFTVVVSDPEKEIHTFHNAMIPRPTQDNSSEKRLADAPRHLKFLGRSSVLQ